jgi:hypothetical protein
LWKEGRKKACPDDLSLVKCADVMDDPPDDDMPLDDDDIVEDIVEDTEEDKEEDKALLAAGGGGDQGPPVHEVESQMDEDEVRPCLAICIVCLSAINSFIDTLDLDATERYHLAVYSQLIRFVFRKKMLSTNYHLPWYQLSLNQLFSRQKENKVY